MKIKELISTILDSEDGSISDFQFISDNNLLSLIKHFANELIIDICVRNDSCCSIDLRDVSVILENNIILINIPDYIKKHIKKRINRNEIIVKFKLD